MHGMKKQRIDCKATVAHRVGTLPNSGEVIDCPAIAEAPAIAGSPIFEGMFTGHVSLFVPVRTFQAHQVLIGHVLLANRDREREREDKLERENGKTSNGHPFLPRLWSFSPKLDRRLTK